MQTPAVHSARDRPRILVVEDNRDGANTLSLLLCLFGYDVRIAYTGPDGVREATEWSPQVVLCDIGLPGLDGYGVAAALRGNPQTSSVRLVAITGYRSDEVRQDAYRAGFDYFFTKPADPVMLQQLLSRLAPDKVR